jgi:hypothetical protein
MRGQFLELEALDRKLERWGWFRRGGTTQGSPGWRYRAGAVLVRLGEWLKGEGVPTRVPGSGGAAVD